MLALDAVAPWCETGLAWPSTSGYARCGMYQTRLFGHDDAM